MVSLISLIMNAMVAPISIPGSCTNDRSIWANYVVKDGSVSRFGYEDFLTPESQNCLIKVNTTLSIELFRQECAPENHQMFIWVDSGNKWSFTLDDKTIASTLKCVAMSNHAKLSHNNIWSHNSYLMSAPRGEHYNVEKHYAVFDHGVTESRVPGVASQFFYSNPLQEVIKVNPFPNFKPEFRPKLTVLLFSGLWLTGIRHSKVDGLDCGVCYLYDGPIGSSFEVVDNDGGDVHYMVWPHHRCRSSSADGRNMGVGHKMTVTGDDMVDYNLRVGSVWIKCAATDDWPAEDTGSVVSWPVKTLAKFY